MTKKIVLVSALLLGVNWYAAAQVKEGMDTAGHRKVNYIHTEAHKHFNPKISLGVGVGFANMYGDFSTSVPMPVARIGMGCRLTTNLVINLDAYFGQLSSKENPQNWAPNGFSETSSFQSLDLIAKITLGNYLQYPHGILLKTLSGIYIGTGVGVINNNITSFKGGYNSPDLNLMLSNGAFTQSHTLTPFIPINIGLRIPLKRFLGSIRTQIMINYQINFTFSDYVDGYKYTTNDNDNRNQFKDCYSVLTFGLSFHLSKN